MSGDGTLNTESKGLYHSHKHNSAHALVGPGHILVLDFEVIDKLLRMIVNKLNIEPIMHTEIKTKLESIQSKLLIVKSVIKRQVGDTSEVTNDLQKDIQIKLQEVSSIVSAVSAALDQAIINSPENTALLQGAKTSINDNMKLLENEVSKYFAKIETKAAQPRSKI